MKYRFGPPSSKPAMSQSVDDLVFNESPDTTASFLSCSRLSTARLSTEMQNTTAWIICLASCLLLIPLEPAAMAEPSDSSTRFYRGTFGRPVNSANFNLKLPEPPSFTDTIRNGFWSFGLGASRHSLKGGDGNELVGNSLEVSIGTGYLRHKWYAFGSLNILLGPYGPTLEKQLNVDYSGTGFTYWWGYSAQELSLRSHAGGYGFSMGLQYSDLSGRSLGRNRKQVGDTNNPANIGQINNFTMRMTNFSLVPGVFFCWLKPGRPTGNTRNLLKTRIEGYMLTLGFALPIVSTYRARFDQKERDDTTGSGEIIDIRRSQPGRLNGYSITISFASLLGV